MLPELRCSAGTAAASAKGLAVSHASYAAFAPVMCNTLPVAAQAALFGVAAGWQLRPHLFTAAKQQFEPDDVDK